MIRFVYIGNQINEWENDFAFYDTCINRFVDFDGEHIFNSRDDFSFFKDHELYDRCSGLIPSIYVDTLDDKLVCNRVNNLDNNRCINCGAKAGQKCELVK